MRISIHTPRVFRIKGGLVAASLAGLLLLSACGKAAEPEPLTGPSDTLTIYRANCVSCHGTELQGKMGETTNLTQVGSRLTEEEIKHQIEAGGGAMPAFSERLTEDEIGQLASWLAEQK
ncbi:mono/diheme cytochrome c family protein [Paenibacillus phyllosphaerae]|uniref:Mono/diheme cytochrome c family protein n=1 Tax=Paenibacillus phyllosphaerae TaxID=274593 RepID=A0A7W5FQG1_9BACL|nr:cytochrome c [Paenibacillus phyllosphaerae]MBB3113009.1 mono/diheme cytochrome c family protein [Paenibacillus phyllosphaerae]